MEQSCLPSQSYYRSCSKIGKHKARTPSHPYGPAPAHNTTTIKEPSPLIPVTTYLRLLGLLMYLLTKSRPDIMTDVSFGATKSTSPTQDDYNQLYYIVECIRTTAGKGRRIYIGTSSAIQLYCEVDASYTFRFQGAYRIHYGSTSQWYLLQPKCQTDSGINLFHPC
jgi:hypothetical protein